MNDNFISSERFQFLQNAKPKKFPTLIPLQKVLTLFLQYYFVLFLQYVFYYVTRVHGFMAKIFNSLLNMTYT